MLPRAPYKSGHLLACTRVLHLSDLCNSHSTCSTVWYFSYDYQIKRWYSTNSYIRIAVSCGIIATFLRLNYFGFFDL